MPATSTLTTDVTQTQIEAEYPGSEERTDPLHDHGPFRWHRGVRIISFATG